MRSAICTPARKEIRLAITVPPLTQLEGIVGCLTGKLHCQRTHCPRAIHVLTLLSCIVFISSGTLSWDLRAHCSGPARACLRKVASLVRKLPQRCCSHNAHGRGAPSIDAPAVLVGGALVLGVSQGAVHTLSAGATPAARSQSRSNCLRWSRGSEALVAFDCIAVMSLEH